jgi:pSer/pThr/pTyr-binding forkhead associated (FHA) protein
MGLELRHSTFIITREDRAEDAKTLVTEGLRIGRQNDCDLVLNHPTVSRLHAGINRVGRRFYLINLSGSNATTLNGRVVAFDETEALADGDQIRIGPFFLLVERAEDQTLKLGVSHQFALTVGDTEARLEDRPEHLQQEETTVEFVPRDVAGALKVFWDKRTREKAGRQSPLHPHNPPRLGKARFNWTPTRDLVRPWPFSIFVWGVIVVAALSAFAAIKYKNAFAPKPVSAPHARADFTLTPPIAKEPNNNSCTTCHAIGVSSENRERMESNCASCHQTESFVATQTRAHIDAGITCTVCHTEHRGSEFKPMNRALGSCTACHTDENRKLYNGRRVSTPHGGTLGYPVKNNEWVWKGLDAEELSLKPEVARLRRPADTEQQWRNKQFHALHLYRVRAVASIEGIKDEDAGGGIRVISCSSCHSSFSPIDRETPRTTCIHCHNAKIFEPAVRSVRSADSPSCTSCHVQHVRDTHWRPNLFADAPLDWPEGVTAK